MYFVSFAAWTAICYWVVFMDGADVLEGWKSMFVFDFWAGLLNAEQLKLYAALSWVVSLIGLIYHLFAASL